jgi:hypothetical protein
MLGKICQNGIMAGLDALRGDLILRSMYSIVKLHLRL